MRTIVERTTAHGTTLTLCGEMGGKPLEAVVLIALGFRGLSMSPASIGPVKAAIIATDYAAFESFVVDLVLRIDGGVRDAHPCGGARP